MRYRDIKLVEANDDVLGGTAPGRICRAVARAYARGRQSQIRLALGSAEEFAQRYPEHRDEIDRCIRAGGGTGLTGAGPGASVAGPGKAAGREGDGIANGIQGIGPGGTEKGTGKSDQPSTSNSDAAGKGPADNSGTTDGDEQGTTTKDSQQDVDNANALKASADKLEQLLNAEDWQGAKDLIEGDPNLQALVPSSLKTDLDAAIQATANAKEADRLAQEAAADKAAADKKAAKDKADANARATAAAAAEADRLAQEEQRLADEAERERKAVLQAEADAAEAKRQTNAA